MSTNRKYEKFDQTLRCTCLPAALFMQADEDMWSVVRQAHASKSGVARGFK